MASRYRSTRPTHERKPLGPGEARANIQSTPAHSVKDEMHTSTSPQILPHGKSLDPNGSLDIRSSSPLPPPSPGNKRVSAIVEQEKPRNTKRDSEISNASSTASGAQKRKRKIGRWQLGKTIGKGGCSTVRLVRHVDSGQIGAVKIISRKMAETVRAQSLANLVDADKSIADLVAAGKMLPPPPPGLMREIAVMKLLDHPNIVRLYDVWENRNELYLIMEYVKGGELFHYIEQCRGLDEDESVYIFRQIVAALLYCHRLSIHHRDLKPENILLDRENLQVKLVDFGMAALQPHGAMLTTACGSPHYAAPEVIRGRPYDGGKADVWSCGVILYVMLTGTTPYNYDNEHNLKVMYEAIANANYYMPPELSWEAKDLIQRIFQRDPRKRISMSEIWEHPLLHKYDEEWGMPSLEEQKLGLLGPSPIDPRFMAQDEDDIDREILRNMRTLWHSVPERTLIKRLLSKDPNQEKYFYAALLKHREEHLENYAGGADAVSYSASDYHHNSPGMEDAPPMPTGKQTSQSQYSIMNNEHLKPSHSFVEPPSDASTYDPFRASRAKLEGKHDSYANVIVHRRGASRSSTGKPRTATAAQSMRQPHNQRVEALKRGSVRSNRSSSTLGNSPSVAKTMHSHKRSMSRGSTLGRRSMSRESMASSVWPSSPPTIDSHHRSRSGHKRGVSFNHVRRSSTASHLTAAGSINYEAYTPELAAKARQSQIEYAQEPVAAVSSPAAHAGNAVRSRKENTSTPAAPRVRGHKPGTPSTHMRADIRQISSELEKACEDAFFRSSVDSSINTSISMSEKPAAYDTPPSSVSRPSPKLGLYPSADVPGSYRPLPALPTDTPNTFIARTLEETRNKIAARSMTEGESNAKFDEVLATLEKIIPGASAGLDKQRVTSAPEAKAGDSVGFLPIITEEGRGDESPHERYRSVTAPVSRKEVGKRNDDGTIRVVPETSSMERNARKGHVEAYMGHEQGSQHLQAPTLAGRLLRKKSTDSAVGLPVPKSADENEAPEQEQRRPSWLRRFRSSEKTQEQPKPAVPQPWADMDDRQAAKKVQRKAAPPPIKISPVPEEVGVSHPTSSSSEFPIRAKEASSESKGFAKWFHKRPKTPKSPKEPKPSSSSGPAPDSPSTVHQQEPTTRHAPTSTHPAYNPCPFRTTAPPPPPHLDPIPSATSLHNYSTTSPSSPSAPPTQGAPTEPTRSWFARFLRLRPASHIHCFSIPRGRARHALMSLLASWAAAGHGIADLVFFPADNIITFRVDKTNALGIKPVVVRVELFVVLEHGRKVGLSLARWSQVRGAASGFEQAVGTVEGVLRERGVLVEDEGKWRAMCESLGE
ncbi:serine/threonine-protein kinase gin4 [Zalaria obscura]|uniref:Serine/threonine-protein kinase gin4 n=1 Tax=Zalaria obscura TaxID=2024903 RepID=A0ACC3SK93_9PEZI